LEAGVLFKEGRFFECNSTIDKALKLARTTSGLDPKGLALANLGMEL